MGAGIGILPGDGGFTRLPFLYFVGRIEAVDARPVNRRCRDTFVGGLLRLVAPHGKSGDHHD
jgi:hypothetical protein